MRNEILMCEWCRDHYCPNCSDSEDTQAYCSMECEEEHDAETDAETDEE